MGCESNYTHTKLDLACAVEPRMDWNNSKGLKDFNLKATAIIWP
jgi:hypothetical protein